MKRNYLFFWFAVLLLLFSPARSYAEVHSGTCGENVNWTLDTETGLLEITGSGDIKDYDFIDGPPWCSYRSSIKKCTIKKGVTSIGEYAFYYCYGLTSITIPESVTSIGSGAFKDCTGLTNITIPESVTSIGSSAFSGCTGLTNVTIPESVTSIGSSAFSGCTGLTNVTIGNSVTSIGEWAFNGCTGLTSITIPEGVTSIGRYAFKGCTGLTSITWNAISCTSIDSDAFNGIEENITSFTFGDKVQTIPGNICSYMSKLTSITIPEGVTSIGGSAFKGCTGLTSITIPEGVTSIETYAFSGCTRLTSITWNAVSCTSIHYEAFNGIEENITSFTFGDKVQTIPGNICSYMSKLTSITIPEGVTSIGGSAFKGCTGLTSVTIPESVTSIGGSAFSRCTGLTSITIPEGVTSIGEYAFYCCTGLTNVTIGNSVTSIGNYAFYCCTGLTHVTIGNSVTSIGNYAFYCCTGLTNITIGNSVTSIGRYAFEDCTRLTSITIPESVTSIGNQAFYDCTGLTSITIPESVTSIGNQAFYDCSNLKTIVNLSDLNITKGSSYYGYVAYYANKVVKADTQVGEFCFEETTDGDKLVGYIGNESEVTLPEEYDGKNYGIGDYAFFDCPNLNTVVLSKGINEVEPFAFTDNKGITVISSNNVAADNEYFCSEDGILFSKDMTRLVRFPEGKEGSSYSIPETVTSIADNAFHKCTTLSSITVSANATSVGSGAFSDCSTITSISIPDNVTSIGAETFAGCSSLRIVELGRSVATIGADAFKDCSKMRQIKCYSLDPPLCEDGALSGLDTWDCSLFIPEGTESLYKAADQWKEFFFIEEITGIDTPKTDNGKNTVYDIYDMNGRLVRKAATTTDGLKPGLYIINGKKILVK